jgi:hypothetical protein
MVNWMIVVPLLVAAMGLWELVTGRPLYAAARWPLGQRATRWGGVYALVTGLLVVVLAVTYSSGIAFVTFAILSIAFGGTIELTRRRRTRT